MYLLVECNQINLKRNVKRAKLDIKEKLHTCKIHPPPPLILIHTLYKETETFYIHKSSNS